MNLLAIDTSTELATVALIANGELFSEKKDAIRQHAQYLLPMIDHLLTKAALSFQQLNGIVFGCGPGSFTGIRIACSIAKGLAYAHDLPLYPVSSLAAIASEAYYTVTHPKADVLAVIDARMEQLYWGCFTKEFLDIEEHVSFPSDIKITSKYPLILAGVGFEPYISKLPQEIQSTIVKQCTIFPNATAMLRIVQSGKVNAVKAIEALPAYVRNQVAHVAKGGIGG